MFIFFFTNLEAKRSKGENLYSSTNLGTSQVEENFLTFWYKLQTANISNFDSSVANLMYMNEIRLGKRYLAYEVRYNQNNFFFKELLMQSRRLNDEE